MNTHTTPEKPSRAFIIGDKDHGLTIVITDPVMVVHYSKADLENIDINRMAAQGPTKSMAAVVQELLPVLRGTNLDKLAKAESDIRNDPHGTSSLEDERKVYQELNYANTIGRLINANGTVCDVDFCIALDVDPCLIVTRGRMTNPAKKIGAYLNEYGDCTDPTPKTVSTKPQVFDIDTLPHDNLGDLPPWTGP